MSISASSVGETRRRELGGFCCIQDQTLIIRVGAMRNNTDAVNSATSRANNCNYQNNTKPIKDTRINPPA